MNASKSDSTHPSWRTVAVGAVVLVSALAAAGYDASPTGDSTIDLVERVAVAALVTAAGAAARRVPLIVFVTLPTMFAPTPWLFLGLAALALVIAEIALLPDADPVVGAVAAAMSTQVAFHLGDVGFTGFTALVGIGSGALVVTSAVNSLPNRARRRIWSGFAVACVPVGLVVLFTGLGAVRAAPEVDDALTVSSSGLRLARDGDIDSARPLLEQAGASLAAAGESLDGWWSGLASGVPIVAQHQRAAVELAAAGGELATLAGDVTSLVDSEALQGSDGQVDLDAIRVLRDPTRRARSSVDRTRDVVASVDSPWLIGVVANKVHELDDRLAEIAPSTALAADVVELLPGLLGGDGPRHYYLMLLTPSEARELGGLSGSWAEIVVDEGHIELAQRGRSDDLVQETVRLDDSYPASYRESLPGPNPQNYSSTPDMSVATRGAAELFLEARGQAIDGVIALDADALAAVIALTGPIVVPGYDIELTAENTRRFLLYDQYYTFEDRDQRSLYLNGLVDVAFSQLTSGPLPSPDEILSALGPMVEHEHIKLLTFDPAENALLDELGLDGRLEVPDGSDVVGVFHSNTGQNKVDAYLERKIDYTVEIDAATATVESVLTIDLTSSAPSEGPPIVIANREQLSNGTNSANLFALTPLEVDSFTVDGERRNWIAQAEGDLNRRGAPVVVRPGETVTIRIELSGPVDTTDGYSVEVLHQPVVIDDLLSIEVSDTEGSEWIEVDAAGDPGGPDGPVPVTATTTRRFVPPDTNTG